MYDTLKRLFNTGRLPAANLKKAVALNWITTEQYTEITGEVYA